MRIRRSERPFWSPAEDFGEESSGLFLVVVMAVAPVACGNAPLHVVYVLAATGPCRLATGLTCDCSAHRVINFLFYRLFIMAVTACGATDVLVLSRSEFPPCRSQLHHARRHSRLGECQEELLELLGGETFSLLGSFRIGDAVLHGCGDDQESCPVERVRHRGQLGNNVSARASAFDGCDNAIKLPFCSLEPVGNLPLSYLILHGLFLSAAFPAVVPYTSLIMSRFQPALQ